MSETTAQSGETDQGLDLFGKRGGNQEGSAASVKSRFSWLQHFWIGNAIEKFLAWQTSEDFSLRNLILTVLLGFSIFPVGIFYRWVESSTFQKEISYVEENHLTIAKNLSAALSRYVIDLKSVFNLVVQNEAYSDSMADFQGALANFGLCHVSIFDAQNNIINQINGTMRHPMGPPSAETMTYLRKIAAQANGDIVISGIRPHKGEPHFFVVQQLRDGRLASAPWEPNYVIELQQSIKFGERGHSMIVDQHGVVVAHPNAKWQASSKNASKLSVVKAMIAGKTGVMQFYSPPMQADMIAGYTSVPETGWGVMVPQPISELADRARDAQSAAMIMAAAEIYLAVLISLWMSSLLVQPIQVIARTAREITGGITTAHVGKLPKHTPKEIKLLATAFDHMIDEVQTKSRKLKLTLKKAEKVSQERAELLAMARQASDAKSQFVSMVSHELRTPLTSIKGALELLENGTLGDLPPKTKGLVEIAVKNSARLATMIDDLLDLERLDAGKMKYSFADLDVAALIKESITANQGYAVLGEVTFKAVNIDQTVIINGDHNRLMQVMANLLSNAAKFSGPGSLVDVRLEQTETTARILVKDRGVGIPASAHKKVFENFVQLDSSDSRYVGGSGLGLGIAKLIVERHGGSLTFESQQNIGTTFIFELPLVPQERVTCMS